MCDVRECDVIVCNVGVCDVIVCDVIVCDVGRCVYVCDVDVCLMTGVACKKIHDAQGVQTTSKGGAAPCQPKQDTQADT